MSWDECQTSLRAGRAARKHQAARSDDRLGEVPGIEAQSRKGPESAQFAKRTSW